MNRATRPKRPYKSFEAFHKEKLNCLSPSVRSLVWPCFHCWGSARIIDPSERPDVNEGHKLSRRITCPHCVGGQTTREVYRKVYNEEIARWKKAAALFDRNYKAYRAAYAIAKQHLTRLQRVILGIEHGTHRKENTSRRGLRTNSTR